MALIEGKRALLYKLLPFNLYLKIIYYKYHGKMLNVKKPKRFTEKLFWLKKYNMTKQKSLIVSCYDKYTVREYVKNKIGEEYLTDLYGVFDSIDQVEFSKLPDKYVMKITQSCGHNIIHDDSCIFNDEQIYTTFKEWEKEQDDKKALLKNLREESFYFNDNYKIICEELLKEKTGKVPNDIRFFCFNGQPKFVCIDFDTIDENGIKKHDYYYRNAYDLEGNFIPVNVGRPNNPILQMPDIKNFEKMIDVATKLSEDFPFVRVDLYNVDGRIVFGELTWMPQGGNIPITPEEYDIEFGKYLELPC